MDIEDRLPELVRYLRDNSFDEFGNDGPYRDVSLAGAGIGPAWQVKIDGYNYWITGCAKELSPTAEAGFAAGAAVRDEILRLLGSPRVMRADVMAATAMAHGSERRAVAWLGVAHLAVPVKA